MSVFLFVSGVVVGCIMCIYSTALSRNEWRDRYEELYSEVQKRLEGEDH